MDIHTPDVGCAQHQNRGAFCFYERNLHVPMNYLSGLYSVLIIWENKLVSASSSRGDRVLELQVNAQRSSTDPSTNLACVSRPGPRAAHTCTARFASHRARAQPDLAARMIAAAPPWPGLRAGVWSGGRARANGSVCLRGVLWTSWL